MFNWIKKIALKWAIKFLKGKIEDSIKNDPTLGPQLELFWNNIYAMSMNDFLAYCTNTLSKKNLNAISFPMYLKGLISPLRDDVEEVITGVIDGMDPRQ